MEVTNDITQEEIELLNKYISTKDISIVRQILEHQWAYTVNVVWWAINQEYNIAKEGRTNGNS